MFPLVLLASEADKQSYLNTLYSPIDLLTYLVSVVALFNAVAKAKRDTVMEETLKKKKCSEEESVVSRDVASKQSQAPVAANKGWKVVEDTDGIPLVSCCYPSLCFHHN